MSTHNKCFHGEIRRNTNTSLIEKSILLSAMSQELLAVKGSKLSEVVIVSGTLTLIRRSS